MLCVYVYEISRIIREKRRLTQFLFLTTQLGLRDDKKQVQLQKKKENVIRRIVKRSWS